MQHHLVADGDHPFQRQWKAGVDVQHRAVLHVASFADVHMIVFGADDDLEPDADVVVQRDGPDQRRVVGNEMPRAAKLRSAIADREDGHCVVRR
jgi:hypothetical protein